MLSVRILGSGDAGQVPMWGCYCSACELARQDSRYRRGPCSLEIKTEQGITLIDAGRTDLAERYAFEDIQHIILTHFHMDHVQGLFHLRWSERPDKIPVFRPNDTKGTDDLYKHSGVLDFQTPFEPFVRVKFAGFDLTPLPLKHSRITLGYLIETDEIKLAYLTDTVGLPDVTRDFLMGGLMGRYLDYLILDCSVPPVDTPPRNHNDINIALAIHKELAPQKTILTHIGHKLDCWLMENADQLPENMLIARDGMQVV